MDIFAFYSDVLEDEIKLFNISQEKLKQSVTAISNAYSSEALKNGNTFLDYNMPPHRCAYLLKFGPYHTELIYLYFRIFLSNAREVYSTLKQRDELKICCLGGGAGTDIVGIVRALSSFKCLKKKVSSVTVLDICGGWRNSFKRIIQKLKESQDNDVSCAFLDKETLSAKLLSVDLTAPLPDSAINKIKSADIICMVKFVSAVISKPSANDAFKKIANHMKPGAVVIFVDNHYNKVYEPVNSVFNQVGLTCVFGPHHSRFKLKGNYPAKLRLSSRSCFGYRSISVLGWIKHSSVPCADKDFLSDLPDTFCTDRANNEKDWEVFDDADTTYGHCQPIEGSEDEDSFCSNEDSPFGEANSDQSTQNGVYPDASSQNANKLHLSSLENQLTSLASRLDHLEYLVKNITVSNTGKCCSGIKTVCTNGESSGYCLDGLQNNVNQSCSENKSPLNSYAFSSSLQNGCQCCRRADAHNTPFLVLPISRQSALQTVLLSDYNTK